MEIIRGLHNLKSEHRDCVLSIGNFDGVHRGHQALVQRLKTLAQQESVPATVMVFEPMPAEFFRGRDAVPRLQRFREKAAALQALGVDRLLCLRFCERLRSLSAQEFVEQVLLGSLGIRHVIVGKDFHFGADRIGDGAFLADCGERMNFHCESAPLVCVGDEKVGSTAIRQLLADGEPERAAQLLGQNLFYRLGGRVTSGRQVARSLGFPTMNVPLRRNTALRFGVYTVLAHSGTETVQAVANVGVRPTFGDSEALVEVHALYGTGFQYGARIEIDFLHFLRAEKKFDSASALRAQIELDKSSAKQYFKGWKHDG